MNESPLYLSILGYVAVLVTLSLLYAAFFWIARLHALWMRSRRPKAVAASETTGDTMAAIATAVALYLAEQHDEEAGILTIQRKPRFYSPWSSKFQGFTPNPTRRR